MNVYYVFGFPYSDELYHHGVKGQRWGIRRYVDHNGHLTSLGKEHYGVVTGTRSSSSTSNPQSSSVWRGYSAGAQYAQSSLTSTKIRNAAKSSQTLTVQSGKNVVEKALNATTMKTNEGLSTSAIRDALAKKRAEENKKTENKISSKTETNDTKDKTTKKTKKTTKKTSSAKKKTTKKTSSAKKKESSSKKKISANSSTSKVTESKKIVSRSGSSTKVVDLETAGNATLKNRTYDFLKRYRIKTR